MKSIFQKLKDAPITRKLLNTLSKNVSIADYRKHLSEKRAKRASKTKFQKAMSKVAKVPPPEYDRL